MFKIGNISFSWELVKVHYNKLPFWTITRLHNPKRGLYNFDIELRVKDRKLGLYFRLELR